MDAAVNLLLTDIVITNMIINKIIFHRDKQVLSCKFTITFKSVTTDLYDYKDRNLVKTQILRTETRSRNIKITDDNKEICRNLWKLAIKQGAEIVKK